MKGLPFAGSVLLAALSVGCGGNSTGDTHQVDDVGSSPDSGQGRAGSSGAAGAPSSRNGGSSSTDNGGTTGASGSGGSGETAAGAGGVPVPSGGGSAGVAGAGGTPAGEGLDGSVALTCQNQSPQQDGASCTALGLRCGHGCTVCTCEAQSGGGARWKCVALVC